MRKTLLALLGSSLLLTLITIPAEELLADANQTSAGASATSGTNAPAPPVKSQSGDTANAEAAKVAREEAVRRQALQTQARMLIDEGYKLFYDAKYEQAIVKLEEAVKILPRAKATEVDYVRATHALGEAYTQVGEKAFLANDRAKAMDDAKMALTYDPSNHGAEKLIVKVKKADRVAETTAGQSASAQTVATRPDQDPAFEAKRSEVRKLFREGKILLNSGQYDEAEKRFRQVLLIDPYNEDAQEMLREVSQARVPSSLAGQEASRARLMWQAEDAWVPPITGETKSPLANTAAAALPGGTPNQGIIDKLNTITFPEIKFREATLSDVVTYLSDESRKLDEPKHTGVNIVLGPGVVAAGDNAAPAAPAAPGEAPAPVAAPGHTITLSLKNVPMIDALKYVTSLANLKYRVEASAVLILPPDAADDAMITKTYPVTPGVFEKNVTPAGGGGGGIGGGGAGGEFRGIGSGTPTTVTTMDLKALFTDAGVAFPAGSSITYNERTSTVFLHNTPENIEAFERVLPNFDGIPPQVEIEAKFIDISQNDLDELGFDWSVGQYTFGGLSANGGTPSTLFGQGGAANPNANSDITTGLRNSSGIAGDAIQAALGGGAAAATTPPGQLATLQGILTNPQFQLVISALSQKTSTDVLSAPKITTLSGQQAQIKVVDEFIYPSEYSEPQVAAGSGGSSGGNGSAAITPSIPTAFKTREVGVILNVTPTVGADKYTINLTLSPEVSDFLGFLDYSPGNVTSGSTLNGTNVVAGSSVPYKIQQPLFSTRSLQTSVVIWDGQTVVLGGLIKTTISKIDDKVPFLGDLPLIGRLFQSKVSQRSKENLLIFVTARLIGPDGIPIHKQVERGSR